MRTSRSPSSRKACPRRLTERSPSVVASAFSACMRSSASSSPSARSRSSLLAPGPSSRVSAATARLRTSGSSSSAKTPARTSAAAPGCSAPTLGTAATRLAWSGSSSSIRMSSRVGGGTSRLASRNASRSLSAYSPSSSRAPSSASGMGSSAAVSAAAARSGFSSTRISASAVAPVSGSGSPWRTIIECPSASSRMASSSGRSAKDCADRRGERPAQHHLEPARRADRAQHLGERRPIGLQREPAVRDPGLDAGGRRALGGCILGRGSPDQSQEKSRPTGRPAKAGEQRTSGTACFSHPSH